MVKKGLKEERHKKLPLTGTQKWGDWHRHEINNTKEGQNPGV